MSGGGGGGAAKSQGQSRTKPTKEARQIQAATAQGSVPNILEGSRQIFEALTTGGVGARLPVAQRGVEAANVATSQAVEGAREDFARAGMNPNDPFALETLGNLELAGATQAAGIPVDLARELMAAALQISSGVAPVAAGAQKQKQDSSSKEANSFFEIR